MEIDAMTLITKYKNKTSDLEHALLLAEIQIETLQQELESRGEQQDPQEDQETTE